MKKYFASAMEKLIVSLVLAVLMFLFAEILKHVPPAAPYISRLTEQVEPVAIIAGIVAAVVLLFIYFPIAILGRRRNTRSAASLIGLELLNDAGVAVMLPAIILWITGHYAIALLLAAFGVVTVMFAAFLRDKWIP